MAALQELSEKLEWNIKIQAAKYFGEGVVQLGKNGGLPLLCHSQHWLTAFLTQNKSSAPSIPPPDDIDSQSWACLL